MKMRIGGYEFEGSPEELLALKRALEAEKAAEAEQSVSAVSSDAYDPVASDFVSEDAAYAVLARRPLSADQRKLLVLLYKAGNNWVAAEELQNKLSYSTSSFAGLMGSFGRRIAYTRGVGVYDKFFDQRWDDDLGYNFYRLPPSVRTALEKAQVVRP